MHRQNRNQRILLSGRLVTSILIMASAVLLTVGGSECYGNAADYLGKDTYGSMQNSRMEVLQGGVQRKGGEIAELNVYIRLIENASEVDLPMILRDSLDIQQDERGYLLMNPGRLRDDGEHRRFEPESKRIEELLARHYASRGYFHAQIDSITLSESDPLELSIFSNPGCRYSIGSMEIRMADNDEDFLNDLVLYYGEGDPYDSALLEAELQSYVSHFESLGYPLAGVNITAFDTDRQRCEAALTIEITTDDEFYAAGVETDGLEQHQPDYIETASDIRENDLITPELIRRGRRNIENTGFFYEVSDGELLVRDGEPYVYYEVTERPANNFDLMFGYVPGQVEGYNVIGRGEMIIRNAGWAGSSMNLSFERLENMVTRLDAGYGRQWVKGIPAGGEIQFYFLQQDTSYQVREWQMEGFYNWTPERKITLTLRQENASANSDPALPLRVLDGVTRSVGIGFEFDNTDSRISPTAGLVFNLDMESGIRRITDVRAEELESRGTMMQQRVSSTLQTFHSPFTRQVVAIKLHGATVESPEYTETDLMRLGGSRSIRGYREEQFRATRTGWGDLEYRYLLDPYSHAFAFMAGGIYEHSSMLSSDQEDFSEWLYSGGFGFRYRTPLGIMQFTYAVSAEDPLHNGKVHFNLSADF